MEELFYKKHIFICTNMKQKGKCCGSEEISHEAIKALKNLLQNLNLTGPGGVRVSSSGCLGRCDDGPIAVLYPEGSWFELKDTQQWENLQNNIASLT